MEPHTFPRAAIELWYISDVLEIQARCDMILSRLSSASCADNFTERKHRAHGVFGPLRLHAAHVLSMDALLAAGLELGNYAPEAWAHVFK